MVCWPVALSLVKATMEGVVLYPVSTLSITRGLPFSITATQLFVVPKSTPITKGSVFHPGTLIVCII
jgi:hypothetical protein